MNGFSLPTNIKQIGSIGDGMRIYMEDYVCTYLAQYAEAGGYDERLALLVGRYLLIDGQPVLFISGAIQGQYTKDKEGILLFTERSYSYADAIMAEYFEGMEIVGWMQTQPGYGTFLNQQYAAYHFRQFPKFNQVLFVTDPLENINAFYIYNDDRSALLEARGYFIYYDKNTSMHEYMLNNKATEAAYTAQPASYVDIPKIERTDAVERHYHREGSPEETIRRRQEDRSVSKKSMREQKRTLNLLVSLSAVLFVVCFVMGAGLIQNQNRIEAMESQITQLSAAYRNLYAQMGQQGIAAVFAPGVEEPAITPATVTEVDGIAALTDVPVDEEVLVISGIPVQEPINAPEPSPPPPPEPPLEPTVDTQRIIPETYVVQPGDTLSGISVMFYGTQDRVADILALNGITDVDRIIAGTTLLLP